MGATWELRAANVQPLRATVQPAAATNPALKADPDGVVASAVIGV